MELFFLLTLATPVPTLCETVALILARGGSKGVPLKNLQRVGGITLLTRVIQTAKLVGLNVTVSTDHPLIALDALQNKASVFHRNKITATDWAPSIWGASEFVAAHPEISNLVLLQATSPFIQPKYIQNALQKIKFYDCVFAVVR